SLEAKTASGPSHVFVKIPKLDLRRRAPAIMPIEPGDRRMAEEEEASLRLLSRKWRPDELEVRWVSLRGVIADCNAIITDRVFADPAFDIFRRLDLRRRLGLQRD